MQEEIIRTIDAALQSEQEQKQNQLQEHMKDNEDAIENFVIAALVSGAGNLVPNLSSIVRACIGKEKAEVYLILFTV